MTHNKKRESSVKLNGLLPFAAAYQHRTAVVVACHLLLMLEGVAVSRLSFVIVFVLLLLKLGFETRPS